MDVLNVVGSVCSILSLLIALFIANEVRSIKNSNSHNKKRKVTQRDNEVGGDMAGGNITK
jgi:hypothetical protein